MGRSQAYKLPLWIVSSLSSVNQLNRIQLTLLVALTKGQLIFNCQPSLTTIFNLVVMQNFIRLSEILLLYRSTLLAAWLPCGRAIIDQIIKKLCLLPQLLFEELGVEALTCTERIGDHWFNDLCEPAYQCFELTALGLQANGKYLSGLSWAKKRHLTAYLVQFSVNATLRKDI